MTNDTEHEDGNMADGSTMYGRIDGPEGADRDGQVIADLAAQAAHGQVLEPGQRYAFPVPQGGYLQVLDLQDPKFTGRPRRKVGKATVRDANAFVRYVEKHNVRGSTEVWADTATQSLVAVIDAHGDADDQAGWGGHRVELALVRTPQWDAWAKVDGVMQPQEKFAEFIEQRQLDFTKPAGADMLELAQRFEATTSVDFEGASMLQSGSRTLRYKETVTARSGQTGEIQIPRKVELTLAPFYGAVRYKLEGFFRYRIQNTNLALGVTLDNPADVLQDAFEALLDEVVEGFTSVGVEAPLLQGVAPAPVSGS